MTQVKPTLLVLAAGMGSRYGSLKQVDKLGPSGETITDYSIYDAIRAGFGKVVFVIRKSIEADFKEVFSRFNDKIEVDYAFQELDAVPSGIKISAERQKPWGTGHAVLVAADKISTPFAVINADDFYGAQSYKVIADHLIKNINNDKALYSMVGFELNKTLSEHGYVSRGICTEDKNHLLKSVVERTQIQRIGDNIMYKGADDKWQPLQENDIVSMNFWGFPQSVFKHLEIKFKTFIENNYQNPKAEFYIPLAVNDFIHEDVAELKVLRSPDSWFGVTYKEDKELTIKRIHELVEKGIYPKNLWK
jgi:UTP-glucose-1-phosphate uridylyltransferase